VAWAWFTLEPPVPPKNPARSSCDMGPLCPTPSSRGQVTLDLGVRPFLSLGRYTALVLLVTMHSLRSLLGSP
jgi:hypothetical protein